MSAENTARVRKLLEKYAAKHGNRDLLDIGCGTGYILRVAVPLFRHVIGIDVTPAMLAKARTIHGVEAVVEAPGDNLPFIDNSFDVITAYGFLHHLDDLLPTLREARRCLKPNGIFYSDQDPNYYCWTALRGLDEPGVLNREVESVTGVANVVKDRYNIPIAVTEAAEHHKFHGDALRENKLRDTFIKAGFGEVKITYIWFLRQGTVVNKEVAEEVHRVLTELLPLSRPLFKYIMIEAVK